MDLFLFVIKYTVSALIDVLLFAMLIRAITSWFDPMREGKLSLFLMVLTEPVIFPIRMLCDKMNWFENLPIDMPFLLTMIIITLLQLFLIL